MEVKVYLVVEDIEGTPVFVFLDKNEAEEKAMVLNKYRPVYRPWGYSTVIEYAAYELNDLNNIEEEARQEGYLNGYNYGRWFTKNILP